MSISLANIKKDARLKPPKVVFYGVGGIGKTTFAAGAPNPIFLMTEEGLPGREIPRYEIREDDPLIRTWDELLGCLVSLSTEDHDYKTVVIDTIDFAEPLLHQHTSEKHGHPDIEAFGYGKGYTYALDEARELLRALDWLRTNKNMVILLLAHCKAKKFESPTSDSYDRWSMRLHDKLVELIYDWSDATLFANYRTHTIKEKQAFNKERTRAVGQGERVVYTEERPAWLAKNRYGLPPEIILPDLTEGNPWLAFQNAVVAGHAASLPNQE